MYPAKHLKERYEEEKNAATLKITHRSVTRLPLLDSSCVVYACACFGELANQTVRERRKFCGTDKKKERNILNMVELYYL